MGRLSGEAAESEKNCKRADQSPPVVHDALLDRPNFDWCLRPRSHAKTIFHTKSIISLAACRSQGAPCRDNSIGPLRERASALLQVPVFACRAASLSISDCTACAAWAANSFCWVAAAA